MTMEGSIPYLADSGLNTDCFHLKKKKKKTHIINLDLWNTTVLFEFREYKDLGLDSIWWFHYYLFQLYSTKLSILLYTFRILYTFQDKYKL